MNYVQAYISNISFPRSLEEVYDYAGEFDIEKILSGGDYGEDGARWTEWTAPKWCKKGDVVLFMHAKTANSRISKCKTELMNRKEFYSREEFCTIRDALTRAKKLYKHYGGKIFAIGKISGKILCDDIAAQSERHWTSKIYAPISDIFLLDNPIDLSEFNAKIFISRQSSITPVLGEDYRFLKQIILSKNPIVKNYFRDSVAEPMPLCRLNDENWLSVTNQYRREFFLEIQFRSFYVDRLLGKVGDTNKFYKECGCDKGQKTLPRVDNVIKFQGNYLLVEVKLSVAAERDIVSQLSLYCNAKRVKLCKSKTIERGFYKNVALVIDTDNMYIYDDRARKLEAIYALDAITTLEDIGRVKEAIAKSIATDSGYGTCERGAETENC